MGVGRNPYLLVHSSNDHSGYRLGQVKAKSSEFHLGLPVGGRVPSIWAPAAAFPAVQVGSWITSGTAQPGFEPALTRGTSALQEA